MFKLFIGNLSFHTSADRLRQVFSKFGEVTEVFLGTDPNSGRSRGFGFISMGTQDSGLAAIAALDGKDHDSTRQWDHGRDRDRAHDEKREQRFDREP